MLNDKISGFIERNELLSRQGKYIVALSGGADSVALLIVLKALGYHIEAAHCNFHLRGDESDRDEGFCKKLCREHGVGFHVVHFDTRTYADLHKVSIEMAARELRYDYFEKLRRDIKADGICVAHHRDDSVETVLINLIRGTGVHGLTGISPRNGHVVRPMLCVSRSEIIDFLDYIGQDYVTDSTNLVDDVVRNKIRLNIIPLMKDINPAVCENISKMSYRLREAEKVIENAFIKEGFKEVKEGFKEENVYSIDVKKLQAQPSPEYVLFYLLSGCGFSPAQVGQIAGSLDARPGRMWESSTHQLLFDRGRIIVGRKDNALPKAMRMPECGTYVCTSGQKISIRMESVGEGFKISKDKECVCLDAGKVVFPLTLRPVANGDRFVPFGMKGSKLVSDFLTDKKKTLFEKRRQLVVSEAGGGIVWVVGERPDNRFRITDTTVKALVLSIEYIPRRV